MTRADERVRVLFLKEKCFSSAALAKIVHLETVDEILAVLKECYVRRTGTWTKSSVLAGG